MTELDYRPFDCDNHYYEAPDAFTRHVDPAWHRRCVQWCEIEGRKYHVVGGKVSHAVANPTWDPIAKPGALHDYFRGNPDGRSPLEMLKDREPLPAEYMDRDARIEVIERQGLSSVWLFPTLGVLYEELLKHDVEAVKVLFRGVQPVARRGLGLQLSRTPSSPRPYISLCDVDFAVEELEWALDRGARVVCMRPVRGVDHRRPPVAGQPDVRPVLGPPERGRHPARRPRRRLRLLHPGLRRRLLRHVQRRRGRLHAVDQGVQHRARGCATS